MPDPDSIPPRDRDDSPAWWRSILPGLLLAGGGMAAVHAGVGPNLGLFFGGIILIAIVGPPLAAAEACWGRSLAAGFSAAAAVAGWWIAVALRSHDPQHMWPSLEGTLAAVTVLIAFTAAATAATACLRGAGASVGIASLAVTLVMLGWLTLPVWLSALLAGNDRLAGLLGTPHPLMTINGSLPELGFWASDCPLAYNYSALNHDVSFRPPTSVLPCVAVHGMVALALLLPLLVRTLRLQRHAPLRVAANL